MTTILITINDGKYSATLNGLPYVTELPISPVMPGGDAGDVLIPLLNSLLLKELVERSTKR